jgi:hypothetical protein
MNFLAELVVRLFGKTPAFFKTLQIITVIVAVITGLPTFLTQVGIDLPDAWDSIVLKIISASSMVGAFISQLTLTTQEKEVEKIKD